MAYPRVDTAVTSLRAACDQYRERFAHRILSDEELVDARRLLAAVVVATADLQTSWEVEAQPAWRQCIAEPERLLVETSAIISLVDTCLTCRREVERALDDYIHFCAQCGEEGDVYRSAVNDREVVAQAQRAFALYTDSMGMQISLLGMRAELELSAAQAELTSTQTALSVKLNRLTWVLIILTVLAVAAGFGALLSA